MSDRLGVQVSAIWPPLDSLATGVSLRWRPRGFDVVAWIASLGRRRSGGRILVDTYTSKPPKPPGRVEENTSVDPSADIEACSSVSLPFTFGPRLTGADQGTETLFRVAVHKSLAPAPPARSE